MIITEQAKQYLLDISMQGTAKAFHLFATDTCCGAGVGMKIVPKKEIDYIEVEGLSFKFAPDMLLFLHGMVIDIIEVAGLKTIEIKTK